MNDTLLRLVYDRLDRDAAVDEPWAELVMAACEGEAAVEAVLDEQHAAAPLPAPAATASDPPGVFLRSISVAGFRGVGHKTTLEVSSGPGLTLVVGRNGSGKSSFAEALELLLTGENKRWADRSKAWSEGWRNLHVGDPCAIEASLSVEGAGKTTVRRGWAPDADLDDGESVVQPHGKPRTTLEEIGWAEVLGTYRPFLSYNELGSMLDEGPSKLYDALARVLGLDDLVEADAALATARKSRQGAVKQVKDLAGALQTRTRTLADGSPDDRLARALALLGSRRPDLDALEELTDGSGEGEPDDALRLLKQCVAIVVPDPDRVAIVANSLDDAVVARTGFGGTEAERAGELADLLQTALSYHEKHTETDCPVCGREAALGASWQEATVTEVDRLRALARQCQEAEQGLARALRDARSLLAPAPPFLTKLNAAGLDGAALARAWDAWFDGAKVDAAEALADHLRDRFTALEAAASELVDQARAELARREDQWRPVARELTAWLVQARSAEEGKSQVTLIKSAEDWLKQTADGIRADRFAPIAEETKAVWAKLRHRSNVDLENIVLSGAKTNRRVDLEVTVDGVEGAALGVMSQGELHALALSLFLPRAMLAESPFRFVVIDDPVQSMDPARVDGLAHTLADAARTRQVVVFTHDDRLPEAVRRMQLEATVISVTRRPGSVVECRPSRNPIQAHLADAYALAKDTDLPIAAQARVIPGLCRSALEAFFVDVVRRRRINKGQSHAEVEDDLAASHTLNKRAALALVDDVERAGEVMGRLNKQLGDWAGTTFKQCNKGAHDGFDGDLLDLVKRSGHLIDQLRNLR